MKKVIWEVQYLSLPTVKKYCKKCGRKTAFACSGQFRVNAQRKLLDIWLIYKCADCDTTWNAEVYSRITPQALSPELLEGFYQNDGALAERYGMDGEFLRRNGAELMPPSYMVSGDIFSLEEETWLEIKAGHPLPIKVSAVVRDKLHLSQREYAQLVDEGRLKSVPEQDLRKCRLKDGILLCFQGRQEK